MKTRTILYSGVSGPRLHRFVYLDPPGLIRSRWNTKFGFVHTVFITAPSIKMPAVTYFQSTTSQQLSCQRHDRRLVQAPAIAFDTFPKPQGER